MTKVPAFDDFDPTLDVRACTCANLRKAMRVVTQAYDAELQPTGLKSTQFTLLATLGQIGEIPMTRLAEVLVMDRTTLTRNLKPLLRQGFVEMAGDQDQRVRQVRLTEAGQKAVTEALPYWRRVQTKVAQTLGESRWQGFMEDLQAVVSFEKAG